MFIPHKYFLNQQSRSAQSRKLAFINSISQIQTRLFAAGWLIKSFVLFLIIFFWACSVSQEVAPDHLRMQIGAEPPTLNPILASDAYAAQINSYLYDNLLDRNLDTLEFEPRLAKSWKVSEDNKIFTFTLRDDARWHDGVKLTADDVLFSFHLIMNPKINAPQLRVYYQDIEKVEKIDDYTIRFVYKKVYFKALSNCAAMAVLPKHLLEDKIDSFDQIPFNRSPVGYGPYKFKEWRTNSRIVLERNENYYGPKPEIKTLEFKIITDSSVALQVLKKGDLDVLGLRSIQWEKQTGSEKFNNHFYKLKYPDSGYNYIGWNMSHPLFSDKLVRQAMTHMVDRVNLNKKLNYGLATPITGPFMPISDQYNQNVPLLPYSPDEARKLLKQAGWVDSNHDGWLDKDGKKFAFEFLYPSASKTTERVATILKEDLKKIGVDMSITKLEWSAFLDRIEQKKFEATSLAWSTSFETDPYQVWHSSQAKQERGSNFVSFVRHDADELMEKAREEFDEKKRNALYHRFHAIVAEEQPYTFLFNGPELLAVSKRFGNVKVHKLGVDPKEWTVIRD